MKKFTIATYLRPALPEDVFDQDGLGIIKNNREYFFKMPDDSFRGPKRIKALPTDILHSYKEDDLFFLRKKWNLEKSSYLQYLELYRLMEKSKLYIVDAVRYLESVPIHLKIKQVEPADYISNGNVIANTAYFNYDDFRIKGPFYITKKHTTKTFINSVLEAKMFVFDKPGQIKLVQTKPTAEAV